MRNDKNLDVGYVYFIQCGKDGPIKIGFSKHKSAESRLTTAQVYNPTLLTLLCVISGGRRKEKELHKYFTNYHLTGEWFNPNKELSNLIDEQEYLGLTVLSFKRSGPKYNNHHFWKGTEANDTSKRQRTARIFKIEDGKKCEKCLVRPACDRYHKDGNLDNYDIENILILCRRCRMELDGTLINLQTLDRSLSIKPPEQCLICKEFKKPLRKGRCHTCNSYYRRTGRERSEILNECSQIDRNCKIRPAS